MDLPTFVADRQDKKGVTVLTPAMPRLFRIPDRQIDLILGGIRYSLLRLPWLVLSWSFLKSDATQLPLLTEIPIHNLLVML
jgi:hypothetical protein